MKEQIDSEYAAGRNSIWGDDELDNMIRLLDQNRHREFAVIAVRQRFIKARKALHLFIISR